MNNKLVQAYISLSSVDEGSEQLLHSLRLIGEIVPHEMAGVLKGARDDSELTETHQQL